MKGRSDAVRDALAAFRGGLPRDLVSRLRWDGLTDFGNLHFRTPERGVVLAVRRLLPLGLLLRVVSAGDGWVDSVTIARDVEYSKPWPSPDSAGERASGESSNERGDQ